MHRCTKMLQRHISVTLRRLLVSVAAGMIRSSPGVEASARCSSAGRTESPFAVRLAPRNLGKQRIPTQQAPAKSTTRPKRETKSLLQ